MLKGRAEVSTSDSLLFLKETDSGTNGSRGINIILIRAQVCRGLCYLYTQLSHTLSHLDGIQREAMSSWMPGAWHEAVPNMLVPLLPAQKPSKVGGRDIVISIL